MPAYQIKIAKQALKDIKTLSPKLKEKLKAVLMNIISENPYEGKKLIGELAGNFSFRLNLKDRIVYSVDEKNKIVYVKRARTH